MEPNPCLYTRIFVTCTLTIAWPMYGYLMFKWYQNRNHFVIRNRWPNISLVIIVFAITIQILSVIEISTCSKPLETISLGMTNMISGLVFYRAQLLYLRCIRSHQYLNQYWSKAQTKSIGIKKTENRWCCHYFSESILPITVTTSLAIILLRFLHSQFIIICFLITILIGIISLINILRKKLTDSIGVSTEIVLQILTQFAMLAFGPLIKSIVPSYIEVGYWAGILAVTVYGFATLYVALAVIQKNVLCAKTCKKDKEECKQRASSNASSNESITRAVGLNEPSVNQHRMSASVQLQLQLHNGDSATLKKSLLQFIKYDISNYALFAGYLSECFALENLLFLERAIILHHAIKKYEEQDKQFEMTHEPDGRFADLYANGCYELHFNYLCQIKIDIDHLIENTVVSNSEMKYKHGIVKVMLQLYKQFCCYDSDTEINVSYETQTNIRYLFEHKTEDELINQFRSYDDLKIVFHYAIVQCWEMCLSIYGFQFKSYIKRNRIKNRLSVPGNRFVQPQNTQSRIINIKKQLSVISDKPIAHDKRKSQSDIKNMDVNSMDVNVVTPETPLLITSPKETDLDVVYRLAVIETESKTI